MAIDAFTGPVLTFGRANSVSSTFTADYNPQMGPSPFFQGVALYDDRLAYCYQPGQGSSEAVYGWWGSDAIVAIDQVPTTAGENTIAATQSATTTTTRTLTLQTSDTANCTANVSIVRANDGATVTGLLAIDGAMSPITYGSDGSISMWNPANAISRCVRIEGSSNDSGGAFTIKGYDLYGYAMQETLTGPISTTAGSTFVVTQKAFKYIASITCSGTINSTGITVGVADVFGAPLRFTNPGRCNVTLFTTASNTFSTVTASTGFTAGSSATTQTSTTADVRGTWSSTTASDGALRITMTCRPNPAALASTGIFGPTQYSTFATP